MTDQFSQPHSLQTFLEEEVYLGGEAGGKLRSAILTGMDSDEIMTAVQSMALIADSTLFQLLRCIGSDAHNLDVLPTMWCATI